MDWTSTPPTTTTSSVEIADKKLKHETEEETKVVRTIMSDLIEFIETTSTPIMAQIKKLSAASTDDDDSMSERELWAELDDYFESCSDESDDDGVVECSNDDDDDDDDGGGGGGDDSTEAAVTAAVTAAMDYLTFGRWRRLPLLSSRFVVRCDACKAKESVYWRRVARRLIVCNACFYKKTYLILFNDDHFKKSLFVDSTATTATSGDTESTTSTRSKEPGNKKKKSSSSSKSTNNHNSQINKKHPDSSLAGNRPLTRTALNGGAINKNNKQQQNNAVVAVSSSSSHNPSLSNLPNSIKSEPQLSNNSNSTVNGTNCSNGSMNGSNGLVSCSNNVKEDEQSKDLCSIENKLAQNVRKSARISQSKTKSKIKESSTGEENIELNENGDLITKQNGNATNASIDATTAMTNTNRRTKLFKNRKPNRLPTVPSTQPQAPLVHKICAHEYTLHRGFLMRVGDIVGLHAAKNGHNNDELYFAQIRALTCDQYGAKSAVLTWLIPKTAAAVVVNGCTPRTTTEFDLNNYTLGPAEDDTPRSLDSLEFVCRPTDTLSMSSSSSYDHLNQYKSDLLRHRFDLEDLAASNCRIISTAAETTTDTNGIVVKHEFATI